MARWKSESSLDDEVTCLASERHAVMNHIKNGYVWALSLAGRGAV